MILTGETEVQGAVQMTLFT